MDRLSKLCWLALAAVHATPAAVFFRPSLTNNLYGVEPSGPVGLLLVHRGALFLAVVVVAVLAAFQREARKAATLLLGISLIGFLIVYAGAGSPEGPLRTLAAVDVFALLPLAYVTWSAWRR